MLLSKLVLWIPNLSRPPIHVRFCMRLDEYIFATQKYGMGSVLSVVCLCLGGWLVYTKYYLSLPVLLPQAVELAPVGPLPPMSSSSSDVEQEIGLKLLDEPFVAADYGRSYRSVPLVLFFSSWFVLNLVYQFRKNYNLAKGILAWALYVVLHFLVPVVTTLWLYLFHPQGAAGLFCWTLGVQNIATLATNFVFPNAPPLYVRVYGDNKPPSYDMKFTDGISRSDMKIGPHIHKAVYYATPTKFGAFPSLHSATAVTAFLFVCYYSRYRALKVLAFVYVVFQWWAAVYSEHHWRTDLLAGMFYSLCTFTMIYSHRKSFYKLDEKFATARRRGDHRAGTTGGMRLAANTGMVSWFDPLERL